MKNNENNFGFFKADEVITWEETQRAQRNSMVEAKKRTEELSVLPNEVLLP